MIQKIINEYIRDKYESREKKNPITLSQLGKCIRQLVLKFRATKPCLDFTNRQLRVFEMGNLVEQFTMNALKKKQVLIEEQIPVEYRGYKGVADGIAYDEFMKEQYLFDVKSVHSMKFNYLDKVGPDEGYCYQLVSYWLGLREQGRDISYVPRLVYLSKDDMRIKEIDISVNGWKDKIDQKIDLIDKCKEREDLPPEKEKINWECFSTGKGGCKAWCRWIKNCSRVYSQYLNSGGKEI